MNKILKRLKRLMSFKGLVIVILLLVVGGGLASYFFLESDNAVGPNLITSVLGVVLSAIVTLYLLTGQTKEEEDKETRVKMYENKLKSFAQFNQLMWQNEEISDEKLRNKFMQIMFYLDDQQTKALLDEAQNWKEAERLPERRKAKSQIAKILKDALNGEKVGCKAEWIEKLAMALTPDNFDKTIQQPVSQPVAKPAIESVKNQEPSFTRDEVQAMIKNVEDGEAECWHFAALEPSIQQNAFDDGKRMISLIEYGESWRTERLQQVNGGDLICLFYRGGSGYVGLYRAVGTVVLERQENGKWYLIQNNTPARQIDENSDELRQYDIYDAIEDGADHVASVIVEPVIDMRGRSGNPINVIRQTLARTSYTNFQLLIQYFNPKNNDNE